MQLTELITQLTKLRLTHGDIEVRAYNDELDEEMGISLTEYNQDDPLQPVILILLQKD